jgi:hypothetical protein
MRLAASRGSRVAVEDFEGTQLRIDEALKDRQKGDARIGDTKTDESDNFVPVPPDLEREVGAWIANHPNRNDPRAFLFPSSAGTAYSVGNYLKRYLKPLAEKAGLPDVTHQAFRRTSSTHMQNHATVRDMQRHLRHTDPQTTLKHYAKVIPESLRSAVAALDAQITGTPAEPKKRAWHPTIPRENPRLFGANEEAFSRSKTVRSVGAPPERSLPEHRSARAGHPVRWSRVII